MIRQIKFRCWHKAQRKMFGVKGLSFDYCQEMGIKGEEVGVLIGMPYSDELSIANWQTQGLSIANHSPTCDSCILMQFTGLSDSKGNEIYEGDILKEESTRFTTYTGAVVFNAGCFRFNYTKGRSKALSPIGQKQLYKHEVIGNIHENPELLTVPSAAQGGKQ